MYPSQTTPEEVGWEQTQVTFDYPHIRLKVGTLASEGIQALYTVLALFSFLSCLLNQLKSPQKPNQLFLLSPSYSLSFFFAPPHAGDCWTQGLTHAMQALYH
jgi:hypothetical protein